MSGAKETNQKQQTKRKSKKTGRTVMMIARHLESAVGLAMISQISISLRARNRHQTTIWLMIPAILFRMGAGNFQTEFYNFWLSSFFVDYHYALRWRISKPLNALFKCSPNAKAVESFGENTGRGARPIYRRPILPDSSIGRSRLEIYCNHLLSGDIFVFFFVFPVDARPFVDQISFSGIFR